ncbi:DMT family transporter [Thermodesulforhabdus norvegica]|uniref:Threonine/homoserine efflux transporter RhtA n=1 Tax=Thermodesulforhabdus norvegica TaxID=39841 RepID=A0A1I4SCL4_9BACT|nr:DMT family transporter [Thermodesulforhabdus norvegica]SFM62219.1 Threonine/homoserine efflux transporter RhtA [Thermodesulforhabdus norvegica]
MHTPAWKICTVVLTGILAVSSASLFIRMASAPALTVAVYRVVIATTLLLISHFLRKDRKRETKKAPFPVIVGSGFCLAAHFAFWIASLDHTSVAVSVSLANTSPIFVVLMSVFFLKEKPGLTFWVGLPAAIIGSICLVQSGTSYENGNILGAGLAIAGAITLAGYLLMGRYALKRMPFHSYILYVYGTASIVLLILCVLLSTPLKGFSAQTYLYLILIGLIPQLIGHSAFNWALQHLPAFVVSVLILGEPMGATILAHLFLDEKISFSQAAGLAILGAGLVTCSLSAPTHSVDREIQTQ